MDISAWESETKFQHGLEFSDAASDDIAKTVLFHVHFTFHIV